MNWATIKACLSYSLGSDSGLRHCLLRMAVSLSLCFLMMTMSVDELAGSVDSSNAIRANRDVLACQMAVIDASSADMKQLIEAEMRY